MEGRFKWELLVGTGVMGIERVGPTTGAHGNAPRKWANGLTATDDLLCGRDRVVVARERLPSIHPSIHQPRTLEHQSEQPFPETRKP